MGDHRFSFKATFEMHGVKDELDLGWYNWSAYDGGIDRRITDWLENAVKRSMVKHDEQVAKVYAEQHKAELEKQERADLERLQKKYGGQHG
jgi:hypothetical protein